MIPKAAWKVTLDGVDLTAKLKPLLISLSLTERLDGSADELEIRLDDSAGTLAIPKDGVTLRVYMGWEQGDNLPIGLIDKGTFKVDEASMEGPPDIITVHARSADFTNSFRVRKQRSFVGHTLGQILAAIASDNGLKLNIDANLSSKIIPALGHNAKSDAALMKLLGRRFDAVATVKAGTLIFTQIGQGKTATGAAIPTVTIKRRDTGRFSYKRPSRSQYGGIEARWHNMDTGHQDKVYSGDINSQYKPKCLRKIYANEADAQHAADAEAGRMNREKATVSFPLALGRPDLFPDRLITLTGWKEEIDSHQWVIAETTHAMEGSGGLTSRLSLEATW